KRGSGRVVKGGFSAQTPLMILLCPSCPSWRKDALLMLKRMTLMLAILSLVLTTLAACGSTQQNGNSNSTTITFMTFSAAPDHLKDLNTIRQAFEAANPGIHVQVLPVAFDQYFTKLQVAVAGNGAPDTFAVDYH